MGAGLEAVLSYEGEDFKDTFGLTFEVEYIPYSGNIWRFIQFLVLATFNFGKIAVAMNDVDWPAWHSKIKLVM